MGTPVDGEVGEGGDLPGRDITDLGVSHKTLLLDTEETRY